MAYVNGRKEKLAEGRGNKKQAVIRYLQSFAEKHGWRLVSQCRPEHVDQWLDEHPGWKRTAASGWWGTKYQWLRNPDNMTDDQWRDFGELRRSNLKTARAWALKEQAMLLWNYRYEGRARKHFDWWYRWATHSRLQPMIAKAKMLVFHMGFPYPHHEAELGCAVLAVMLFAMIAFPVAKGLPLWAGVPLAALPLVLFIGTCVVFYYRTRR